MLKSTKNAVAVALIALCTACGQDNPTPSTTSTVVTPPPTPPTTPNKCDNIKNPLEEIERLRNAVQNSKEKKYPTKITQYTYKGKPIYHLEVNDCGGMPWLSFATCDLSIKAAGQYSCGFAPPPETETKLYSQITQEATNPIILFEQK